MDDVNNSFSAPFIKPKHWPLLLPKISSSDDNKNSDLLFKYLAYHAAAAASQQQAQQPAKDIIYPWMREGHPGNNLIGKIPFQLHYDPSGSAEAPLSPDPTPPISLGSPGKLKWMS